MEFISLLTGIFWKLYDDYADNKEAYSFLENYSIILQVCVFLLTFFLIFKDNIFLIYTIIVVVCDFIIYLLKMKDKNIKLNYALDTFCWKLGGLVACILFFFRITTILKTFTIYDYGFIGIGVFFILAEVISQLTSDKKIIEDEKENNLFLEASNQKFITRFLQLFTVILFYRFLAVKFDFAQNFKNILLFSSSYMYVSIISILYLKYYYFYLDGKDIFEK